jgi:hypothetical protein
MLPVSLIFSFRCVWPFQGFLDGRNVFVIKRACVAVLVSGLSFRVPSEGQTPVSICFWPIFSDSALLHCCCLAVLALVMFFLSHKSSFCLIFPSRFLSSVISLTSHNFFHLFVCYDHASFVGTLCTISGSILLYGHNSMGRHKIPEGENLNMMLLWLSQGLYEPHTHFCSLAC